MSKIYLFRGKAATGKSTIANRLSKELHIPVFRKDDIYDSLSKYQLDHSLKNNVSYDILIKIIQTNIDLGCDFIIDIALPHNPFIAEFLSQINFRDSKLQQFLCVCSDKEIWENRINERVKNPLPNQIFANAYEAANHYSKFEISLLDNENLIDSADNIEIIINQIIGKGHNTQRSEYNFGL